MNEMNQCVAKTDLALALSRYATARSKPTDAGLSPAFYTLDIYNSNVYVISDVPDTRQEKGRPTSDT